MQELQQLYRHPNPEDLQERNGFEMAEGDDWLLSIIREIFDSHYFIKNSAAARAFYNKLLSGATDGFGEVIDAEDEAMMQALQNDVVRFSDAKDAAMQRAMLQALTDEEGRLRSWGDFRTVAYSIGEIHKDAWLRAEYELSISSAQMAAKWNQIVKNSQTLPLLQFDAVMDNRTTHTCRSLEGVILPVDHWVWGMYYPPNHWGCRSTVRSLASGNVTSINDVTLPDVPKMFQTNLAKNGLLFPPGHPYYKNQKA